MSKKKITKEIIITEEIIDDENELTQIVCILDCSGSMSMDSLIVEARNGFNNFIKEQKEIPGRATVTVALFDDKYELLYDNVDLKNVKEITQDVWYARGTTALYDAIGKTVNSVKANHTKLGKYEKPDKVLVCIVTDGLENASREYTQQSVKSLIENCEKDNWNFIYLAANQDAFEIGTTLGFSGGNTFTYANTSDGVNVSYSTISNAATQYRTVSSKSADFDDLSKNLLADKDDENEDDE